MTEASKRLQATLGGFSMVTALTQGAINNAMAALVTAQPEMAHIDCSTNRGDSIKGTIAEPLVSLKVIGETHTELEYTTRFVSGTLHFDYGEGEKSFDVANWEIAFDVDWDTTDIEEGSEENKRVKAAIDQAGDYSIKSLFLVFNLGDIIKPNLDHCNFQGADLESDDILYIAAILAKWYIDEGPMTDRQNRTIGYGLHTSDPSSVNEDAATFPPTSLKFQTYGYIAPGKTEPDEGIGAGDNNMLLYLQMTDNQAFPSDPFLAYSGNFAAAGMDGTMAIDRSIIWDSYLLRTTSELLNTLNHATYVWVKTADVDSTTNPNWEIGIGDSIHSASPDFFSWNPTGTMSWSWGLPQKESEQHSKKEGWNGNSYGRITVDCTTSNTMSTKSGSNIIQIGGKSDIKVSVSCGHESVTLPWATEYGVHVWLEWSTTITMKGEDSGGLRMELDLSDNVFKVDNDPISFFGSQIGVTKSDVERRQGALQDNLKEALKNSALQSVEEALQTNLNSTARFVVPGQGTFSYKDPVFNDNGDLLIEVGYIQ
ncbi:uncharacterized protein BO88DRAFT_449471 [Aspergillus vadensis CBS 113365]|uniref:Uncharacterized protein n=1 Tax=Aspergillus vadensis (strain CBS 113365 / IMI 142717 / IBT 24658) TaxID=1448311 RepID=A0A319BML4_ASPVC|nr:hypothetical protein BO88DRAFT_449471 [Aspergillus vadensis CBS 113365]PYH73601.1 hypothetical protein BO88DRAFT_449471 [Aspergillus vadensis CBS 113365]